MKCLSLLTRENGVMNAHDLRGCGEHREAKGHWRLELVSRPCPCPLTFLSAAHKPMEPTLGPGRLIQQAPSLLTDVLKRLQNHSVPKWISRPPLPPDSQPELAPRVWGQARGLGVTTSHLPGACRSLHLSCPHSLSCVSFSWGGDTGAVP